MAPPKAAAGAFCSLGDVVLEGAVVDRHHAAVVVADRPSKDPIEAVDRPVADEQTVFDHGRGPDVVQDGTAAGDVLAALGHVAGEGGGSDRQAGPVDIGDRTAGRVAADPGGDNPIAGHHDLIECQAAAVVEDAAAQRDRAESPVMVVPVALPFAMVRSSMRTAVESPLMLKTRVVLPPLTVILLAPGPLMARSSVRLSSLPRVIVPFSPL